ncbi:MAG: biosynthetic-type acetolactate synthase large subunit [Paratractidigestivibacter faecalis]|uniref:biosynthetic-type acetolactate synthase large subunit n=1 Tax=Paratractidigestivibacter faecalis TaxID=2292441 RepID=UPI002A918A5E|nr:biosynthetic-type acetolactate synthase large subunit [Paratractidigestivibacter faecalis]MDY6014304.1 biosynthetic-type acetolactate synthase large subunit [Paratractidigestivibacter faecalis]
MTTLEEKMAMRKLAIEGKPFGPGSHTPHEGKTMTGAQAIIASLEAEGVDTIFGYPGGQAIKIYDALYDSKQIHHVLARHEQGATHMADGYARATGKVGVVLVTSGPGATNTVTGIATAYMDSIPMVVITGQVTRGVIGTDSFQESDIVGITMPVVKHSFLLQSTDDLTRTFREAFYIASTGRPGPVLIDIPSDLSGAEMVFHYPDSVNLPSYKPTYRGNARQVKQAAELIQKAERPLLYAGGGIVTSHACAELTELAERMQIPVVTTLMGKGAMRCSNPLNLGPVGMHGSKYANMAVTECDLLIAVGARFSDRVTGKVSEFAPHANVIHIDIDPAEIGKIINPVVPIVGDAKVVLAAINERLAKADAQPIDRTWVDDVFSWRERWPFYTSDFSDYPNAIAPEVVLRKLSQKLDPEASIVTTEVGQHQMWAHQNIHREHARTFISSGGLGTMGFGFPAAIGAKIGCPESEVVCVAGDGSFQMNSQEMATAKINDVPIKVLIIDNRALGMVHQWQSLFYNKRYSFTELADNPDFVKLADAYGWRARRVEKPEDVDAALDEMLASKEPYLLDVMIPRDQTVYPMVAPGAPIDDIIGALDVTLGGVRVSEKGFGKPVAAPTAPEPDEKGGDE